tara:strand:+ start:108 stop:1007 length:900 start_codon:yes stop_codon:yes gene_type:complete
MIPVPANTRVGLAAGVTVMRRVRSIGGPGRSDAEAGPVCGAFAGKSEGYFHDHCPSYLRKHVLSGSGQLIAQQSMRREKLRYQLAGHRCARFGTSSESIEQLQLAMEPRAIAVAKMTAKLRLPDEEPVGHSRDKPKRPPIICRSIAKARSSSATGLIWAAQLWLITDRRGIERIAQIYTAEKEARGSPPDRRVEIRQAKARSIFDDQNVWLHGQLPNISGKSTLAAAIRYALTRMARLRPYLEHGVLKLDNNTTERAVRSIAIGRKNYLFVVPQPGGKAAAIAYSLIKTAKLNDIDPQA